MILLSLYNHMGKDILCSLEDYSQLMFYCLALIDPLLIFLSTRPVVGNFFFDLRSYNYTITIYAAYLKKELIKTFEARAMPQMPHWTNYYPL